METIRLWETIFIQGQLSATRQINFETEWYNEIMHKQKERIRLDKQKINSTLSVTLAPCPALESSYDGVCV